MGGIAVEGFEGGAGGVGTVDFAFAAVADTSGADTLPLGLKTTGSPFGFGIGERERLGVRTALPERELDSALPTSDLLTSDLDVRTALLDRGVNTAAIPCKVLEVIPAPAVNG